MELSLYNWLKALYLLIWGVNLIIVPGIVKEICEY
jgi:hypothetical protein